MKQVNIPEFVGGLVFIGVAAWSFSAGHPIWATAALVVGLCSVIDSLQWIIGNWRSRPWGSPMSAQERRSFGERLVFEPTCLHAGCHGPVVELINGEVPRKIRPITGPAFDPEVPHFYSQGAAACRRCRRRYTYSASQGMLSFSSSEGGLRSTAAPVTSL
jgi:hypothetical protein